MECPDCKGKGVVYTNDPCPVCEGVGSKKGTDDHGNEKKFTCATCQATGKDTDTCGMCGGSGNV